MHVGTATLGPHGSQAGMHCTAHMHQTHALHTGTNVLHVHACTRMHTLHTHTECMKTRHTPCTDCALFSVLAHPYADHFFLQTVLGGRSGRKKSDSQVHLDALCGSIHYPTPVFFCARMCVHACVRACPCDILLLKNMRRHGTTELWHVHLHSRDLL